MDVAYSKWEFVAFALFVKKFVFRAQKNDVFLPMKNANFDGP